MFKSKMLSFYISLLLFYVLSLDCSTLPIQNITLTFYSDLDDWVVGNLYPNGAYAVAVGNNYTRNVPPNGLAIWESAYPYDFWQNLICYIGKSFYIPGTPTSATLKILADDLSSVKLNNVDTGCITNKWNVIFSCDLTQFIVAGLNTLNISVTNNQGNSALINYGSLNYCLTVTTSVRAVDLV